MADDSLALLTAHPEWALVLEAYRAREAEIRATAAETQRAEGRGFKKGAKKGPEPVAEESVAPESAAPEPASPDPAPAAADEAGDAEVDSPGWSERLHEVAGIERAALSGIHGRLIAFGLLKCEVGPRSAGLVYRPSNQGKSALKSFQLGQSAPLAETA